MLNVTDRVPKRIYYCWFGEEKPQQVIECVSNWKKKLPGYEIIEINDNLLAALHLQAEASGRKRMNYDLRTTAEDTS